MDSPKLTTVRDRTEALLYDPRDRSAHARSRWLLDRTTAVSPKRVKLSHLRMRLQRQHFARSTRSDPLAETQASISGAVTFCLILRPSNICLPSREPKLALAAAWSRNRRRWTREAQGRGGLDRIISSVCQRRK